MSRLPRPCGCLAAGLLVALGLSAGGALAEPSALPRTQEDLVRVVKAALLGHDHETFDALINWEGAGEIKKRIVRFQIRHEFGRPIRSIAVEPFPRNGLDSLKERGTLAANMPVTHRLRIEFDEPPRPDGNPPADVFLIGQEEGAYRIALVVRSKTKKDDD